MIIVSQTAISSTVCIQSIGNFNVPVSGNGVGVGVGDRTDRRAQLRHVDVATLTGCSSDSSASNTVVLSPPAQ